MAQAETLEKVDLKTDLNSFLNQVFLSGNVDTPFIKCAGEHTSTKTLVEWGIDKLKKTESVEPPMRGGHQYRPPHGGESEISPEPSNIPKKGVNVHQINSKVASVEIPLKGVKQIGNTNEFRSQVTKKVIELRQQMEITALSWQKGYFGSDTKNKETYEGEWQAGANKYKIGDYVRIGRDYYINKTGNNGASPRNDAVNWDPVDVADRTASAPTYLRTNVVRAQDASAPTDSVKYGFPETVGDRGSAGNPLNFNDLAGLQESIFKNANRSCPLVLGSMEAKVQFFLHLVDGRSVRVGTEYRNIDYDLKAFESANADFIVTEKGSFLLVPNNFMSDVDLDMYLFFFNPDYWKISYLENRRLKEKILAPVGDTVDVMILNDWAVVCGNEAASGAIFELKS